MTLVAARLPDQPAQLVEQRPDRGVVGADERYAVAILHRPVILRRLYLDPPACAALDTPCAAGFHPALGRCPVEVSGPVLLPWPAGGCGDPRSGRTSGPRRRSSGGRHLGDIRCTARAAAGERLIGFVAREASGANGIRIATAVMKIVGRTPRVTRASSV
jgi:hypothetical protein